MALNGGFSGKGDSAFLLALARGVAVKTAAQAAGVSERTASRRLADPEFRRAVSAARAALLDRAIGQLADASSDAAEVLKGLLNVADPRIRVRAATSILELAPKLRESAELEERVAELERLAKEKANGVKRPN